VVNGTLLKAWRWMEMYNPRDLEQIEDANKKGRSILTRILDHYIGEIKGIQEGSKFTFSEDEENESGINFTYTINFVMDEDEDDQESLEEEG
jgi:hypothetical protein